MSDSVGLNGDSQSDGSMVSAARGIEDGPESAAATPPRPGSTTRAAAWVDEHRRPGEESVGLYPGLVISDGVHSRQTGSITVGRSRLPLWSFLGSAVASGWQSAVDGYYTEEYEETFPCGQAVAFVSALVDLRGEFGRLLLLLADPRWQTQKRRRKQLAAQMRRCLGKLEEAS